MQLYKSNTVKSALIGIYNLLFITFVVVSLYLGRVILMPLALAILLAFLFSPLVSKLEQKIGRILSVLLIIILMTIVSGFTIYILSKEFIRFTMDLPVYKTNVDTKISSLAAYKEIFSNSSSTLKALETKLSGNKPSSVIMGTESINFDQLLLNFISSIFGSFVSFMLTTFLVLILFSFILIDREDLRGRFIRLIGQGRIAATTNAINDASSRVSRYLWMLLLINIFYAITVAIGLYFLSIPNALLWGVLSGIFRFIPYVGVWIAAAVPIGLSFAISNYWIIPLLTIGLFVVLEIVCANILEPLFYGMRTGVSATALLIAAVFWTLLWGPVGLLLSTPLTVCLVVLGRYVPRFEFFSILLSDEEPLTLYQEYYQRLLVTNVYEITQLTDNYLKDNSLTSFYNDVLIPIIATIEIDYRKEILDDEQLHNAQQTLSDIIEDLSVKLSNNEKITSDEKQYSDLKKEEINKTKLKHSKDLIICLPAKAKRDELVGDMLTQLLNQEYYHTKNISSPFNTEEIFDLIENNKPEMIIISVLPPSTIIHARYLSKKIKSQFPKLKLIVGLWGYTEKVDELSERLSSLGINKIVTNLGDAILYIKTNKS